MLKEARFSLILETLNERNYLSLQELMKITNSSESTIRADLVALANEGKIIRLRGGAQALNKDLVSYELSLEDKQTIEVEAKKKIAEYAAQFVNEDSIIYIDAGTTTIFILDYIDKNKVTIVTNSLTIAKKAKVRSFKVIVIGGDIKLKTDAFVGPVALDIINNFTFDVGFFGANGVTLDEGITTPEIEEALVKKTAMARCNKLFVLVDHTKVGVRTAVTFHPFIGHEIITDKLFNRNYKNKGIVEAK